VGVGEGEWEMVRGGRSTFSTSSPFSPAHAIPAPPRTHTPAAMAGRDDDNHGGGGARRVAARVDEPPVYVCGLEVGLLDVGRVVALNGYADACKRLAYVASSFYLERDLLMATKHVRYGVKQRTRLMSLARKGDAERVAFLLKVGADMGARDAGGWTPLLLASWQGHEPVVRLLLDRGADTSAALPSGWTPLLLASWQGHESIVRLLLDRGADTSAATTSGSTPLHIASQWGHEPVVRLLLDRGADIRAARTDGSTPLSIASHMGHASIVRLLREAGGPT
jgi:ankyrin repeat protein